MVFLCRSALSVVPLHPPSPPLRAQFIVAAARLIGGRRSLCLAAGDRLRVREEHQDRSAPLIEGSAGLDFHVLYWIHSPYYHLQMRHAGLEQDYRVAEG